MRTFLVSVFLVAIFIHQDVSGRHCNKEGHWKKFKHDMKQCLQEYDLPEETFKQRLPIPDDKICFFHCLQEKKGLMNSEGEITFEKFREQNRWMSDELLELNQQCIDAATSEKKCEKAKEISHCMKKTFQKEWEKHMHVKKECMAEFDIDKENFNKHLPIPEDKKCFFKCVAVKSGKMNEDGEWTIDEFKANNPMVPKWMIKNLNSCSEANDMDDPCDSAKALMKCMRNKHKQWKHKQE